MVKILITLLATISLPNALYASDWMKFGKNGKYILDLTSIYKSNQIVSYTWRNFLDTNSKVTWKGKNYSEHVGYVNCKSSETKTAEWMPWMKIVDQKIPKYVFNNFCLRNLSEKITKKEDSKSLKINNNSYSQFDSLGLPVIKGWNKIVDDGTVVYYVNPTLFNLKVREKYGRYLLRETLIRWYENPSSISTGGLAASKIYNVVDCEDKTYRGYGRFKSYKLPRRWKKIEPDTMESRISGSCPQINLLPKTNYPKI